MMKRVEASAAALGLVALLSAFTSASALAQDVEPIRIDRIADRSEVTLDSGKAYLLVEGTGMMVSTFFKLPSDEMRVDWARQREEALAEAREDHVRAMARYERDLAYFEARNSAQRRPELPVEPTEENFAWPELESRQTMTLGPQNRFANDDVSLWLYEVPAGEYIFYGLGMPEFMDCACMGSVRFEVPVGQVTAVRIEPTALDPRANPIAEFPDGTDGTDRVVRSGLLIEGPSELAFDPRIANWVRPAQFAPVPSLPNWYGGTINRVLPIDGVFAYDGLQMVDRREQPTSSAGGQ
ncbi:hypothetical protein [Aurantiacibacter poecillastricola]|uniref:hypothetical protein n=1 Tax=Aurantiacibacter poecillastricola TaxID=3064385 RepID=UPI00273D293B|nr:hypothetical protein [Aurantiacibacter sp. 219JJ12-13]MDP5262810.1 hypothetical protein [Aurantiacibacter sp. 219JJ12-13]